jgi:electron transfer flavoprotein alpha subunit
VTLLNNPTALVVIEQDATGFSPINLKVMGAIECLRKFTRLTVDLLVVGKDCTAVAETAARIPGISQVLVADGSGGEHQLPEALSPWLADLAFAYDYLVMGSTTFGKNLLPRVAALMDIQPVTDVVAIESTNTFQRPIYAGNALMRVMTDQATTLLSIRASVFTAVRFGELVAPVIAIAPPPAQVLSRLLSQQQVQVYTERPELTAARVVVSGGRGLQSGDNFQLLYQLADKLEAAVGASRAAVDAGFAANDIQVGQTGKVVAPELYIAVGLSGAIQHIAGMRDSKVVVAINKDPDAPIFQVADYGLVADLFTAIPELIELL